MIFFFEEEEFGGCKEKPIKSPPGESRPILVSLLPSSSPFLPAQLVLPVFDPLPSHRP